MASTSVYHVSQPFLDQTSVSTCDPPTGDRRPPGRRFGSGRTWVGTGDRVGDQTERVDISPPFVGTGFVHVYLLHGKVLDRPRSPLIYESFGV